MDNFKDVVENSDAEEVVFKVNYISTTSPDLDEIFLSRFDHDAYIQACGKTFKFAIFPSRIDESIIHLYRPEFIQLSILGLSFTVRRLVLLDDYARYSESLSNINSLMVVCHEKIALYETRLAKMEEEMSFMLNSEENSTMTSRFFGLLSHNIGVETVQSVLLKEITTMKYSKRSKDLRELLSDTNVYKCYDLLQYWILIRNVQLVCKNSLTSQLRSEKSDSAFIGKTALVRRYSGLWSEAMEIHITESVDTNPSANVSAQSSVQKTNRSSRSKIEKSSSFLDAMSNPGNVVADAHPFPAKMFWKDMVTLAGASNDTLVSVLRSLTQIIMERPCADAVSQATLEYLETACHAITEKDMMNLDMYDVLGLVLDELSGYLDGFLNSFLRRSSKWMPLLSTFRRDRMIKQDLHLATKGGLELELTDDDVALRSVIIANDFIDTDVLHGSMQRLKLFIAVEEARKTSAVITEKRKRAAGELACLVQYAYDLAAPYIQRNIRTYLAKKARRFQLRELVLQAMHAAAIRIQSFMRRKKAYIVVASIPAFDFNPPAVMIQKTFRGLLGRRRFARMKRDRLLENHNRCARLIQKVWRGVMGRRLFEKVKLENAVRLREERRYWACVNIQRVARSYIARVTVIRSLRIRQHLSRDVMRMAERYLDRGDVWGFLQEVDGHFHRLNADLSTHLEQEERWAKTFVEHVLVKRRAEFDEAWDRFSSVLGEGGGRRSAILPNLVAVSNIGADRGVGKDTGLGRGERGKRVRRRRRGAGAREEEVGVEVRGEESRGVPGAALRRAITATVQMKLEEEQQKVESAGRDIRRVREAYASTGPGKGSVRGRGRGRGRGAVQERTSRSRESPSLEGAQRPSRLYQDYSSSTRTGVSLASPSLSSIGSDWMTRSIVSNRSPIRGKHSSATLSSSLPRGPSSPVPYHSTSSLGSSPGRGLSAEKRARGAGDSAAGRQTSSSTGGALRQGSVGDGAVGSGIGKQSSVSFYDSDADDITGT